MAHPAEEYNKVKQIVFSILNKKNTLAAYKMLDNYRAKLPETSWYGLKAELDFYVNYKEKYTLDPTFDFGIKCDFVGNINNLNNCRLDVTTNINFKNLKDYEAIQKKDNRRYKIVVMNKDNGNIEDIVDLNFPFNKSNNGRLFDIALFMPSEKNDYGLKYNFYQKIVTINSNNPTDDVTFKSDFTDYFIPDFEYLTSEFEGVNIDYVKEVEQHAIKGAKVISKTTGINIVACGQRYYNIINPSNADGEWITKIYWKHPVIESYLDDYFYSDISEVW